MSKQIIGVLGGMGPQATCDLFQKILNNTPAAKDQDHLHLIIDNNTQIPDRTAFFQGQGPDPTPELVASAKRLAGAGCNLLLIPCNTAHYFADAVEQAAGIPVLNMIRNTAHVAQGMLPPHAAVGLLATSGTLKQQLYHQALTAVGLVPIVPDEAHQADVMQLIYGVKAGRSDEQLRAEARRLADHLIAQGAQAIIAGCTEIPLVIADGDVSVPVLDATELLAKAAVAQASH